MTDTVPMSSNRPYLIRAVHDWITDNNCTPYLLVDAAADDVVVPTEYIDDGRIVLNVSRSATDTLTIGNEEIRFRARFGGQAMEVWVPITAVLAIYARENGKGMMFPPDEPVPTPDRPDHRPALKVVK